MKKILLNLITLGMFSIIANHKARKLVKEPQKVLSYDEPLGFEPELLYKALGTKANVLGVKVAGGKIKFEIRDFNALDLNWFRNNFQAGVLKSSNHLTIMSGKQTVQIGKLFN